MINNIIEVLNNASLKIEEKQFSDRYQYKNSNIPRTTEILSAMLHEDYLMGWSNSLGFKRISYRAYLKEAADKGTYTHNSIEQYLVHNKELDLEEIPFRAREATKNGYESFKEWWKCINKGNTIEILEIEKKLVCKYFGGTLDCLLKINGKIWLIDFKTSNHVSYKYHLQLASYAYMLKEEYRIEVDGCLILQVNKEEVNFNEYVLDLNREDHKEYFNECIDEFLLLVAAYYGRLRIEKKYKDILKTAY